MNRGIFIQTNESQLLAAKVAQFAMKTRGCAAEHGIPVTLMNVAEIKEFRAFSGIPYRRATETKRYDVDGVQSFTLSRFMPPELMGYSGRALVIDPDVFALADVGSLFSMNLQDNSIAASRWRYGWDSSVMVLDCAKLLHWKVADILADLATQRRDYYDLIFLRREEKILELAALWNSRDKINTDTRILHLTQVLTQPWKTGLRVEFEARHVPSVFRALPSKIVRNLFARRVTQYQPHASREIENTFLTILKEALDFGDITQSDVTGAIARGLVRPDLRERIAELA